MTRIVILAAGEGTRLRPFTEKLPKALVPLAGRSLLDRQLAVVRRAGITDISLVTGHAAAMFDGLGLRLFHNPRFASTNMVASLRSAGSLFDGQDDVLVAYGDIVYEQRVLACLLETRAPIAVVVDTGWLNLWRLRMDDPLADAESLRLGDDGRILELGRRPRGLDEIEGQYIGLIKVDRSFAPLFFEYYDRWPPALPFEGRQVESMYMTSYLQHQIDNGTLVRAARVCHGWIEVDSIDDLSRYEQAITSGHLACLYDHEPERSLGVGVGASVPEC